MCKRSNIYVNLLFSFRVNVDAYHGNANVVPGLIWDMGKPTLPWIYLNK
jgi:hypothetical protein